VFTLRSDISMNLVTSVVMAGAAASHERAWEASRMARGSPAVRKDVTSDGASAKAPDAPAPARELELELELEALAELLPLPRLVDGAHTRSTTLAGASVRVADSALPAAST
jgi:hypothetical protein